MPNVFLWQGNYYKTCLSNLDPRSKQKKNKIKCYVKRWAGRDSITSYFNFIHKISIIFNFTSWNVGRSNTVFSQTDCACLQICPLFKTQMLIEKWLFLEISLYYRIFAMLILRTTYPLWVFGWEIYPKF